MWRGARRRTTSNDDAGMAQCSGVKPLFNPCRAHSSVLFSAQLTRRADVLLARQAVDNQVSHHQRPTGQSSSISVGFGLGDKALEVLNVRCTRG